MEIYNTQKNKPEMELSGAINALLDEYKKAVEELIQTIQTLSEKQLCTIVDKQTNDPDCQSIQSVLTHVIRSGYGYIIYIENHIGISKPRPEKVSYNSVNNYINELRFMFSYAMNFFQQNPQLPIEELDNTKKINVNWGQQYDIEQLLEHAIVHILRHRRQIEKFVAQIQKSSL